MSVIARTESVAPDEATASKVPARVVAAVGIPVLLGVVAVAVRPISDPRAWTAVREGRLLRETWQFVARDPASPFATADVVRTEWAGDLVAAFAHDTWGPAGLIVLRALAVVALAVLFLRAARREADLVPAVIATFVGLFGSLSLGEEPMTAGVVLAMVSVLGWRGAAAGLRPPWWLVPVVWVWASTDGSWVFGPLLGVVTAAGLALDGRLDRSTARRFAAVILASIAAAALTPVGPRLLLTPIRAYRGESGVLAGWTLVDITNPLAVLTAGAAVLLLVSWLRSAARPTWWKVAHAGTALVIALSFGRAVPFAACLLVPLVAEGLQALRGTSTERPGRLEGRALVLGVLVGVVVCAGLAVPLSQVDRDAPAAFRSELSRLPSGTVVFGYHQTASWLLLFEPQLQVVMDARPELYAPADVAAYVSALRAEPDWSEVVDRSGATVALLPSGSPLGTALRERRGWSVVRASADYVLLAAR